MGAHRWIAEERQVAALWVLAVTLLVVGGVLEHLAPPGGWLLFELPALVEPPELSQPQREAALLGIGLDFLYLALYPLFLSLLFGRASERWRLGPWLSRTSGQGAVAVLVCGPLDVAENVGLFFMVTGPTDESLAWLVTLPAALKWFVIAWALPLAIACLVVRHMRRRQGWAALPDVSEQPRRPPPARSSS